MNIKYKNFVYIYIYIQTFSISLCFKLYLALRKKKGENIKKLTQMNKKLV